jgi:glycosyltransferase involved in cell wall biosynthesis
MAMEVPVLATRVGGTPEVVADGQTGRLVEPKSPEAMAGAIADFLSDPAPWKQMAERGRRTVETQFNFQVRTRRLESIYAGLVAREQS